ncbi:MAG: glycosyltransferase [Acidobacteriaceae bacterium]
MSKPLFSIVIACYNHEKFIREAVESALRQEHSSKEVIVVDDASKDKSAEVLESFGHSIVFERLPENRGAAAARNHGASIARGKYLVFLDGDDVLTPWSLRVYGTIIGQRNPMLILGRSSVFYGDPPTMKTQAPPNIQFAEYATFLDKDRPWVYNTSSLVVARAAFWDVGGWSEDIFFQDIQDLLNKLCVAGTTNIVLAPETVLYRMHSTNAIRQVARFIEGIRVLLAKAGQGAYPGGHKVSMKRSAWFGGLIFYWAKEGMRNGLFLDGLKLLFANGWMVLLATIRRAVAWSAGRRPIEVLPLEPNTPENEVASRPAHPPVGSILGEYERPVKKA